MYTYELVTDLEGNMVLWKTNQYSELSGKWQINDSMELFEMGFNWKEVRKLLKGYEVEKL